MTVSSSLGHLFAVHDSLKRILRVKYIQEFINRNSVQVFPLENYAIVITSEVNLIAGHFEWIIAASRFQYIESSVALRHSSESTLGNVSLSILKFLSILDSTCVVTVSSVSQNNEDKKEG